MAKATFIKAARKDIYVRGKRVEAVHERGKNAGQSILKSIALNLQMRTIRFLFTRGNLIGFGLS